jgi:multiple sugar transport system ATP-binding protein
VTTLYVTHDQVEAMTMGDRVAVLKAGVLQQADAPQTLYDRPDNLFVAGFIGSPAMNIAEGSLIREDGKLWLEVGDEAKLIVPDEALDRYPGAADRAGGKVAFGIRPQHFAPADQVAEGQRWPGRKVSLVEMLGAEMLVHLSTSAPPIMSEDMRAAIDDEEAFAELERQAREGGQEFVARFEPDQAFHIGDLIDVGVETEHLHFFDPENGAALR